MASILTNPLGAHQAVPCFMPSLLDGWLQDALDYDRIKARVLSKELDHFPERERVLDFIERKGTFHQAAEQQDREFLEALIHAGIDPNAFNEAGESILSKIKDPLLFKDLVVTHKVLDPTLGHGPKLLSVWAKLVYQDQVWLEKLDLFVEMVPLFSLNDYHRLEGMDLAYLKSLFKQAVARSPLLRAAFEVTFREYCISDPETLCDIIQKMGIDSLWSEFLYLTGEGIVPSDLVSRLVCRPAVLERILRLQDGLAKLGNLWKLEGEAISLLPSCSDNWKLALFTYTLLQTNTLDKAADLLKLFGNLRDQANDPIGCGLIRQIAPSLREEMVRHIQVLQKAENTSIWAKIPSNQKLRCFNYDSAIFLMESLGLDPNDVDPLTGQNFLFFSESYYCELLHIPDRSRINCFHRDVRGNNALEHRCYDYRKDLMIGKRYRRILIRIGLTLGDSFPNLALCRQTFPKDVVLQTELAAFLLHPTLAHCQSIEKEIKDPEEKKRFLAIKSQIEGERNVSLSNAKRRIPETPSKSPHFAMVIPESALACEIVHESIRASLLQDGDVLFNRAVVELTSRASHEDLFHLYNYLFEHPEIMAHMVHQQMRINRVDVKWQGCSESYQGCWVAGLLLRLRPKSGGVNPIHKRIKICFKANVAPVPKKSLDIPSSARVSLLGRTVLCQAEDGSYDAYKFLRPRENYSHFAQEDPVTRAFGDLKGYFETRFISPEGVYSVERAPPCLNPYRDALSIREGKPSYVFHYRTTQETFTYIHEVPNEQFTEARERILRDGTKMILNDIYPESTFFHNDEQRRGYILLIDLIHNLTQDPLQGSGRLDKAFAKLAFPNQRLSGWTDLRDATSSAKELILKTRDMNGLLNIKSYWYAVQMHALSMLLLEDVLFLVKKGRENGTLQWQNEEHMKAFGETLAKALAIVSATYTGKSLEQYTRFYLEGGIDWTMTARQLAFWTDTSETGYPSWIAKNSLPEGLYAAETLVNIDISEVQNFLEKEGFQSNGEQDIGPFNGPLALTEYERALYLLVHPIICSNHL